MVRLVIVMKTDKSVKGRGTEFDRKFYSIMRYGRSAIQKLPVER